MKSIIKQSLLTIIYYVTVYFIATYALEKYPSNGGPSEAVFLLLGFIILSVLIFIYSIYKMIKGDSSKRGSVIIHSLALFLFVYLI